MTCVGWWGSARKINYTGDWLVTLSWCLLCGFRSPVPYFQAVYFLILLIHRSVLFVLSTGRVASDSWADRANRDDEICAEKYGDDWIEYKKRVPYMFVPFVC